MPSLTSTMMKHDCLEGQTSSVDGIQSKPDVLLTHCMPWCGCAMGRNGVVGVPCTQLEHDHVFPVLVLIPSVGSLSLLIPWHLLLVSSLHMCSGSGPPPTHLARSRPFDLPGACPGLPSVGSVRFLRFDWWILASMDLAPPWLTRGWVGGTPTVASGSEDVDTDEEDAYATQAGVGSLPRRRVLVAAMVCGKDEDRMGGRSPERNEGRRQTEAYRQRTTSSPVQNGSSRSLPSGSGR